MTIGKSPNLNLGRKSLNEFDLQKDDKKDSKDFLSKLAGREGNRHGSLRSPDKEKSFQVVLKSSNENGKEEKKNGLNDSLSPNFKIPVNRKPKTNLKNYDTKTEKGKNVYSDLPIIPAIKINKTMKTETSKTDELGERINIDIVEENEDECSDDELGIAHFEGFIYKLTDTKKLKKLWFKLLHKDLYYFKNENDTVHKGMHNLSGVFVKEEKKNNLLMEMSFLHLLLFILKK